nr:putative integron gene cassette protein [uncultured bacterium]
MLPAVERGEGKLYAQMRCVAPQTVSSWKRAAEVYDLIEDSNVQVAEFEYCQPARAGARWAFELSLRKDKCHPRACGPLVATLQRDLTTRGTMNTQRADSLVWPRSRR